MVERLWACKTERTIPLTNNTVLTEESNDFRSETGYHINYVGMHTIWTVSATVHRNTIKETSTNRRISVVFLGAFKTTHAGEAHTGTQFGVHIAYIHACTCCMYMYTVPRRERVWLREANSRIVSQNNRIFLYL